MTVNPRWHALDALRGLSIALMMLNIIPGSWDHSYPQLLHVEWAGLHLIDLVSPTFLFCVGAAIPFSVGRPSDHPYWTIWRRGLLLIGLGLFLNLYPEFDWGHVRLPGTLQRIGLCYAVTATLLRLAGIAREGEESTKVIQRAGVLALLGLGLYGCLLAFAPVPGYGAPRYDPQGSWPAFLDRLLFGVDHLYPYWPVNGHVLFDPDGLLASLPVCFNLLLGAIASLAYRRGAILNLRTLGLGVGLTMICIGVTLNPILPIIKNIWTPSFALLSGGVSLCLLAAFDLAFKYSVTPKLAAGLLTFGSNALLAYSLTYLLRPFADHHFIPQAGQTLSLREWLFQAFCTFGTANFASLLFSLVWLAGLYLVLRLCEGRKWFLRL